MSVLPLLVFVFIGSAVGTGLVRRYALAKRVLDVPNARSSHTMPTPRGGGLSIVAAFLGGVAILGATGLVREGVVVALVGAGGLTALVGFLDDHRPIAARWRIAAHFVAAAWALAWLGGMPPVILHGAVFDLGLGGSIVAAVALVWLLNLYNFMDGIDGIAGTEGLTVCLGAATLYSLQGADWILPALFSVATLGFLIWNFPPARIFMGDAGSGFVGVCLGVLMLDGAAHSAASLWSWLILLGVFAVDATVTLLRRIQRHERVYEAHRSHAYQNAAQRLGRHRPVTLAIAAINVIWLLPWALLVGLGHVDGVLGLVIAYVPLVVLAMRLGAGQPSVLRVAGKSSLV